MGALSNKQLSEWYILLAQQLEAGITLAQAIQLADGIPSRDRYDLVRALEEGMETAEVLERYAPWVPLTDRKLIAAATQSGKLSEVFRSLSERRNAIHENIQRGVSACIYPIFIVHLAALVTPVFQLLEFTRMGDLVLHWDAYIPQVITALAVAWIIIAFAAILLKQNNPHVLAYLPIISNYSKLQSITDFAATLSAFLKAGATFDVAWHEAGISCRDSRILDYADRVAAHAREGISPGSILTPKEAPLPPEFISLYISGEQTGQLDQNLDLLTRLFQEKANLKLKQASEWYPIFIFLGVAAYVGYGIVKFYTSYLDLLMSIIKPGGTSSIK